MNNRIYTSAYVEMSNENEPKKELDQIGGYTVCMLGLNGSTKGYSRSPVPEPQIAIVEDFLRSCRKTPYVRESHSPLSSGLKHSIEKWEPPYVCNGAVIIAALRLGFRIKPAGEPDRAIHAYIGANFEDCCKRLAERGLYWDHGREIACPMAAVASEVERLGRPGLDAYPMFNRIHNPFVSLKTGASDALV
jgi:hypothetical protein